MLDNDSAPSPDDDQGTPAPKPRRRRAASRPAGPPEAATEVAPVVVTEPAPPSPSPEADADAPADEVTEDGTPDVAVVETAAPTASPAAPVVTEFTDAPPARRSRRRATAAAGPPAADIFASAPDLGDLLPPPVAPAEQEAPPAARARRGRRRPAAETEGTAGLLPDLPVSRPDVAPAPEATTEQAGPEAPSETPAPRARRTRSARATTADTADATGTPAEAQPAATDGSAAGEAPAASGGRRRSRRAAAPTEDVPTASGTTDDDVSDAGTGAPQDGSGPDAASDPRGDDHADTSDATDGTDDADDEDSTDRPRRGGRQRRRRGGRGRGAGAGGADASGDDSSDDDASDDDSSDDENDDDSSTGGSEEGDGTGGSRRGRGRSRRRSGGGGDSSDGPSDGAGAQDDDAARSDEDDDSEDDDEDDDGQNDEGSGSSRSSRRRRRRRRRAGGGDDDLTADPDDPPGTVVRIRESRADEVTKVKGSTRLEAKRQRRRDGRGASRKRTVITEAEFLTRRESVDRTLLVRQGEDRTEIAVLEDGVLVEHHVTRASQQSMIGNVYLGKVQNVLPSMEAAFVDIGRGRNAVLYAGEVNWDAVGLGKGAQRTIQDALKPGDPVLAQVSKDPVGHKGARLTGQISLPGRYLVYVPGSTMTGISRKLPETERARLKKVLRRVVPEDAGVIVRTAAEGASETELERDVARLQAQWEDIQKKSGAVSAPARLYSEPDLAIKVVRDVFNEDFTRLVVSGDDTWDTLDGYVRHVAPDLADRMTRWAPEEGAEQDLFVHHRLDEQIAKALDRKVWLPSGGSLVIDRTEAMTVVDVNTGKYTGDGGNLEETVTRNNLEAAEEIVRQLRLRDIGGIIVVDFIDMVLENNRNLVLRRLVECLGRDRTKHQVAEVTTLGLVQLTRKRVGSGLLESFSTSCEHCQGRGLITHSEPIGAGADLPAGPGDTGGRSGGSGGSRPRRGGGRNG